MFSTSLKTKILSHVHARKLWGTFRSFQLLHSYRQRRERYARKAQQLGLRYSEASQIKDIRNRINRRSQLNSKRLGEIHTFAFIPLRGWHSALLPDLSQLGPLSHYDYMSDGTDFNRLLQPTSRAANERRSMNERAFQAIAKAHKEQPIDWIFFYASGIELHHDFLKRIVDELAIPMVNMCLDDKQSWQGPWYDGQYTGQISIAPYFDVSWTSAKVACDWYLVEGARPIYLPEGFDNETYRPLQLTKDIPVSFIGANYGFRLNMVNALRKYGIEVEAYGHGWQRSGVFGEEQVKVFNRSCINLGMGGIGYCESLTNVKTRDFEIPGTGGGLYLTSFNSDLAQHFNIGSEIVCYRNFEEMVELTRYFLHHAEEAQEIAQYGRARCLKEHRWLHRYTRLLEILGIVEENVTVKDSHGDTTNQNIVLRSVAAM